MWSAPAFEPLSRETFSSSLWQHTAPPAPRCDPLAGDAEADVAVVGAGFTGLATAVELARRGRSVVVVEAREPGFGASGRNGGQVIPLFKHEPADVLRRYGEAAGTAILDMVRESALAVFRYAREFAIDCEPSTSGWIQAGEAGPGVELLRRRHQAYAARGDRVRWLERDAMRAATGSDHYAAGWLMEDAGSVQPLGFSRGLTRAAMSLGARIHGQTMVERIERAPSGWTLRTPGGAVSARQVVLATNAYTTAALWPGLAQSIVPLYSIQIATDPLDGEADATILPGRQAVSDTRRLTTYFRRDAAGRFVIGGRGPFRARPADRDAEKLRRNAVALYPVLAGARFRFTWAGRVAVTTDHVPHLHTLAPGVHTALGYNGRGVAMATLMGSVLAAACLDDAAGASRYPRTALRRIPLHPFHRVGVQAVITYYRMLDRMS